MRYYLNIFNLKIIVVHQRSHSKLLLILFYITKKTTAQVFDFKLI